VFTISNFEPITPAICFWGLTFTTWQPEKEAPNGDPKKSSVTHTKDFL
jgi:hypothetical protein